MSPKPTATQHYSNKSNPASISCADTLNILIYKESHAKDKFSDWLNSC